jgi:ribosome recycling factor
MIDAILTETRDKMRKSIEVTTQDLSTVRSGKASPSLVEHIVVTVYGGTATMKLMELATIATSDARTLTITPYDPSVMQEIEHGLQVANTGMTPIVDGEMIRITIPPLTEERRREFLKLAKTKIEAGKIMIRQIRQEAMHQIKKNADDKTISEDQQKMFEKHIQELTDKMVVELEVLEKKKEAELMQV